MSLVTRALDLVPTARWIERLQCLASAVVGLDSPKVTSCTTYDNCVPDHQTSFLW